MRFRQLSPVFLALGLTVSMVGCTPDDAVTVGGSEGEDTSSLLVPSDRPDDIMSGSNEEIAWEALMGPDGEYAAVAHYQAVLDAYGPVEPYATIKVSEERHIEALVRQLTRYGIDIPENPYLGNVDAPADLETAAREWAEGERLNVAMYDRIIGQATDDRLIRVLENLRRASLEQHLPAFEAAAANGGTLDPGSMGGQRNND
jgi:hypothetical protein